MLSDVLLYVGSVIITLWGVAHLAATRPVVSGFGKLSDDNRRIITMEWIVEGVAFCFVGILVALITLRAAPADPIAMLVYRVLAILLLVVAVVSLFTGARTSIRPMQLCPLVKMATAALFLAGSAV
jgi:hypothetical protein